MATSLAPQVAGARNVAVLPYFFVDHAMVDAARPRFGNCAGIATGWRRERELLPRVPACASSIMNPLPRIGAGGKSLIQQVFGAVHVFLGVNLPPYRTGGCGCDLVHRKRALALMIIGVLEAAVAP